MSEIGKLEEKIRQKRREESEELLKIEREELESFTNRWRELLSGAAFTIKKDMDAIEAASKSELEKSLQRQSQQISQLEKNYSRAIELQRKREKTIYRYVIPFVIVAISAAVAMIALSFLAKPPVTEWSVPPSSIDQEGKWISIEEAKNQGIHIHIRKGK